MTTAVRVLVILFLVGAAVGVHVVRALVTPSAPDAERIAAVQQRLDALPLTLADGAFTGRRRSHEKELVIKSGADSHAAAVYVTESREFQFSVFIGGSTNPDVAFHAPSICLPAAGWDLREESLAAFEAFDADDPDSRMRRLHARLGERDMLCYFWFQSESDIADSIWKARFFNLGERLSGAHVRPTYIVVVYAPVRRSLRRTDEAARAFMKALGAPLLDALQEPTE